MDIIRRPIRTCVACKTRSFKELLIRLQYIDENISFFRGSGRSFYICKSCSVDVKKIKKITKKFNIKEEFNINDILREIAIND